MGCSEKFWMRPRADRSTGIFFGHPAPSFHKDQKVFWRCEDDEEHDNILEENPATDILTSHRLRCFFPRPRCYTAGSYVTSYHTSLEPVDTWNGHTTIKCICQIKAMLLLLNQSCCFGPFPTWHRTTSNSNHNPLQSTPVLSSLDYFCVI